MSWSHLQVIEIDFNDESISDEIEMIKSYFGKFQRWIRNDKLLDTIDNEIIRMRFKNSIQDKMEQMQKVVIEFVDKPDITHKQRLSETCNDTNAMNDVLTSLHNEIVNGGNGTFNHLLDGGVSL